MTSLEIPMTNKQVIVVGGGAAGMMAAICAAEREADVTLLEPNERLGKKLNITGKGRCNLTNDADMATLMANIPQNGKFLYSAFSHFDGRDAMVFFEKLGVPLKTERGNRVFPVSDRAFDVSAALERRLKQQKVCLLRQRCTKLLVHDSLIWGVNTQEQSIAADAVILATGGISYPATGSTGDGYRLAQDCGHTITPLRGSLVPLRAAGCEALQGLSLKNIRVNVFENGKKIYTDFGEMLFTHFGVSGPLILSASAHMRAFDQKSYSLEIDLKPALDEESLDKRLLSDFERYANYDFSNALHDLLPKKFITPMVSASKIDPHKKVHDITREERRQLLHLFKHWPVKILAPMPVETAIVTSGGIKISEINPKTMESKIVKGLYFAGEMIDVDAYTGGFNLQIAWATGRLAGQAAAENNERRKGVETD